jgi:modulator of FtsH protease
VFVFALTGFMGYTLGPIISRYLGLPNGGEIVMQAMGGTARSSSACRPTR